MLINVRERTLNQQGHHPSQDVRKHQHTKGYHKCLEVCEVDCCFLRVHECIEKSHMDQINRVGEARKHCEDLMS